MCFFNGCVDLLAYRVEVFPRNAHVLGEEGTEPFDGIFPLPGIHFFLGPIAEIHHSFGMCPCSVGSALQERGPLAVASSFDGVARMAVYSYDIITVHFDGWNVIPLCPAHD